MGTEGFAKRLRKAFRAWEDQFDHDVTETEFGEIVGKEFEGKPISQASVNRWFAGTVPDHARLVALAKVLGVDPGWLAYGPDDDSGDSGGNVLAKPPKRPRPSVERGNLDDHGVDVQMPGKGKRKNIRNRPGDRTARAG